MVWIFFNNVWRGLSWLWWPSVPSLSGKIWNGSDSIIPFENWLDYWLSTGSCTPQTPASCHRAEDSPVCIILHYLSSVLTVTRQQDILWPVCLINLTAKLNDTANAVTPELSFQCKAVHDFFSHQSPISQPPQPVESDCLPVPSPPNTDSHVLLSTNMASTLQMKCTFSSISSDSDAEDIDTS